MSLNTVDLRGIMVGQWSVGEQKGCGFDSNSDLSVWSLHASFLSHDHSRPHPHVGAVACASVLAFVTKLQLLPGRVLRWS